MMGDRTPTGRSSRSAVGPMRVLTATFVLIGVVIVAGVGFVAVLGRRGDDRTWERWSSVGEAFGVVNSVVSALAVLALVITWALQSRELRDQKTALTRSADVQVRQSHVDLIRLALENPHLADVWPRPAGPDPVTRSQYMYSNLMLQHVWLQYTSGVATRDGLISNMRYLFTSPKVRAFWRETANTRTSIYIEDTSEFGLAEIADAIFREYESSQVRRPSSP